MTKPVQPSCRLSRGHGSPPEGVHRHITHPFMYRRWEGYHWIDLNEYIGEAQKVAKEAVAGACGNGVNKAKMGVKTCLGAKFPPLGGSSTPGAKRATSLAANYIPHMLNMLITPHTIAAPTTCIICQHHTRDRPATSRPDLSLIPISVSFRSQSQMVDR